MKKFILTLMVTCSLGMNGCMNGTTTDTVNDTSATNEITWSTVENKLANKIPLDENDCMFLLTDTTLDEGHSEGVGNYLFYFLCGNNKSNKLFINARKHFPKEEGDKYMRNLMNLMSLDIAFAEYGQYDEFLKDFPMFRDCDGAEELFDEINANGIY